MGSWNALYYRRSGMPKDHLQVILDRISITQIDFNDEWNCAHASSEEEIGDALLARMPEAVALSFVGSVDALNYRHFVGGDPYRVLTYGCLEERVWEAVSGHAEGWEAGAFHLPPVVGECEPMIQARDVAQAIADFHGLPGWGPEPSNLRPWPGDTMKPETRIRRSLWRLWG
jgi:hypothetical protein